MSTKNAYKQKIEAEMELVQAKLVEFKDRAKSLTADVSIKHAKQVVDDLERMVDTAKAKLKELGEANEDDWEQHKDGVENVWHVLQSALNDTVIMFEKDV